MLVAERRPGADADLLAHLLLAPLAPDLVHHLDRSVGIGARRLHAELRALAARLAR